MAKVYTALMCSIYISPFTIWKESAQDKGACEVLVTHIDMIIYLKNEATWLIGKW